MQNLSLNLKYILLNPIVFSVSLILFTGCNVEQAPTEFQVTVAPLAGQNAQVRTEMNKPVRINYELDQSDKSKNLKLKIVKLPQHGTISSCDQSNLSLSCIYTPNLDYVGEDRIFFKTQDGDFSSEDQSEVVILISEATVETAPEIEVVEDPLPIINPEQEDPIVDNEDPVQEEEVETPPVISPIVEPTPGPEVPNPEQPEEEDTETAGNYSPGTEEEPETEETPDYTPPAIDYGNTPTEPEEEEIPVYTYQQQSQSITLTSIMSTVCDPLSNGMGGNDSSKGLTGNIRLLNSEYDNKNYRYNLGHYLNLDYSYEVPEKTLFMSSVNVAPRSFDQGFSTQENQVLKINDSPLVEYFNVNLESILKVDNEELAGEYELAIISDDGSRLTIVENEEVGPSQIIRSDNAHAPKFLCSSNSSDEIKYVDLSLGKSIPIKINYFQGPRYRIALQLIWRKKTENQAKSKFCNQGMDNGVQAAQSEGWEPIPSSVFNLPGSIINTCVESYESISELKFKVNYLPDQANSLDQLIKDIKISINDGGASDLEYSGKFEIVKKVLNDKEVEFVLSLSEPIYRDKSKIIKIQYLKNDIQTADTENAETSEENNLEEDNPEIVINI